MKKLIVFCAMIVALGFVATGCGQKPTPEPAAPDSGMQTVDPDLKTEDLGSETNPEDSQ